MRNRGVLFDYNGVIVTDEHLQEQAMARVVGLYGVELTSQGNVEHCLGTTDRAAFEKLQRLFPEQLSHLDTSTLIKEKITTYQDLITRESIVHPAIKNIMESLHVTYKIAVVTASLREECIPVLTQSGLLEFLEGVITADMVTHGKPHPEGYQKGIELLQLPASSIVAIEDTSRGIEAAQQAGLKCIAIASEEGRDRVSHAEQIINSQTELTVERIEQLLSADA